MARSLLSCISAVTSNTIFSLATAAGLKTAWSDKAIQYTFVAGPGDPINLADRITDTNFPAIDYLINKKGARTL